jgi:hypothetical protein
MHAARQGNFNITIPLCKMPRQRPPKGASERKIPLQQPDHSRPDISKETLFDIAEKHGLLKESNGSSIQANDGFAEETSDPPIGRLGEAILWSVSLAMLHFTFDVLVQHQYAVEISWKKIFTTSLQAFGGESFTLPILSAWHPYSESFQYFSSSATLCTLILIRRLYSHIFLHDTKLFCRSSCSSSGV